ncbi:putative short-chain dehydrogenase [Hypoxylon sp. EC38]|nr:putative short-chain dehydrogenase [Hypoxylon sp. EC38]
MPIPAKGTILVTGANGSLGSAIAEQIATKPELSAYHGLYTLGDIRQVAEGINARVSTSEIPPIRALILNAGINDFGNQYWTEDGFDSIFASNYLGHWLLTVLLLKSMDKEAGRIIVIGSQSHNVNDPRNKVTKAFEDPKYKTFVSDAASFEAIAKGQWSPATEDASFRGSFRRYGASKFFLVMMQHELQTRLDADAALNKICIVGVDPGTMISGLQRSAGWFIRVFLFQVIYPIILYINPNGPIRSTSRSAGDVLEAVFGVGEGGELPKDKYFNGRVPLETSEESKDATKRQLVWKETVRLTSLKEGETVLANWQ